MKLGVLSWHVENSLSYGMQDKTYCTTVRCTEHKTNLSLSDNTENGYCTIFGKLSEKKGPPLLTLLKNENYRLVL